MVLGGVQHRRKSFPGILENHFPASLWWAARFKLVLHPWGCGAQSEASGATAALNLNIWSLWNCLKIQVYSGVVTGSSWQAYQIKYRMPSWNLEPVHCWTRWNLQRPRDLLFTFTYKYESFTLNNFKLRVCFVSASADAALRVLCMAEIQGISECYKGTLSH